MSNSYRLGHDGCDAASLCILSTAREESQTSNSATSLTRASSTGAGGQKSVRLAARLAPFGLVHRPVLIRNSSTLLPSGLTNDVLNLLCDKPGLLACAGTDAVRLLDMQAHCRWDSFAACLPVRLSAFSIVWDPWPAKSPKSRFLRGPVLRSLHAQAGIDGCAERSSAV